MGLPSKKTSLQHPVEISPQERDHIIRIRVNLDYITALAQYAALYKNLGWAPVALDSQAGTGFQVDFDQPEATWTYLLMKLILKQARISLAIRLAPDSRLFVLKVNTAFGKEFLDSLGDWRSPCMAQAGDSWENHFLVLPQPWCLSPEHLGDHEDTPLSVIGPGSMVQVPPSTDPASQETWRWLQSTLASNPLGILPPDYYSFSRRLVILPGGISCPRRICPPGKNFIPSSTGHLSCCRP